MRHAIACLLVALSLGSFGPKASAQEVKRDIKGVALGMTPIEAKSAALRNFVCPADVGLLLCQNQKNPENEYLTVGFSTKEPHRALLIIYGFCADGAFDAVFRDIMDDFHGMTEDDIPNKKHKIFVVDKDISGELKFDGICVLLHSNGAVVNKYSFQLKNQALIDESDAFVKNPPTRVAPKL